MKKSNNELNLLRRIGNYYLHIFTLILLFQFLLILFPLTMKPIFTLAILSLLSFIFLSPYSKDRTQELAYVGFKISIIFLVYNSFMYLGKIVDSSNFSLASMKPIMFLLSTLFSIVLVSLYIKRENKLKIDQNLLSLKGMAFLKKNKKGKTRAGDVKLCKNIETEEDVILPFKDRFLHMLILGPTGSGKTSQVILPMIHQDMQNLDYGITVIEPKGDLAERVYAMAKYYGRDTVYFNPTHPDCPYFNPLYGDESEVIENMATTFKMLSASEKSNPFFDNMNENLIRNALKLLKRLKGNNATLVDLSTIVYNSQGQGKIMVNQFARVKTSTVEEAKENGDIASWFLSDYYNERSKTYEHCSGLRSQVSKITSNVHLRRVLNPPDGKNDVDFGQFIEEGKVLAISTAQGELRDLGRFLGYFIILNFQSAVFKRPGNEDTRRPHFLYIDEFQTYSNPGFADMLTQGRSYRVASHLATQNRALMAMGGGKDGGNFVELVSTNARNVILFPGGNSKDAKYYSDEFGDTLKKKKEATTNRTKFSFFINPKKASAPSVNIRETETMDKRFSSSDIIYKAFGEVMYRIVENNTLQAPGVGQVEWLPWDFNNTLTQMIDDYKDGKEIGPISEGIEEDEDIVDLMEEDTMDVIISFDDPLLEAKPIKKEVETKTIPKDRAEVFKGNKEANSEGVSHTNKNKETASRDIDIEEDMDNNAQGIDFEDDFEYDDDFMGEGSADTTDEDDIDDMEGFEMDDMFAENTGSRRFIDEDNEEEIKTKEVESIKDPLSEADFDDLI